MAFGGCVGLISSINVAQAATIFSDFGAGNTFNPNAGYSINVFEQWMGFTPQVSADVTQIDIALTTSQPTNNHATVGLWRVDGFYNGGNPIVALITGTFWSVTAIPPFFNPAVSTISGITGVHLNAGDPYYLSAFTNIQDSSNVWNDNAIGAVGPIITLLGVQGAVPTYSNGTLGAFDIIGDITTTAPGIPLPGTLPLFATGLGALGLLGWRRKRKQAS